MIGWSTAFKPLTLSRAKKNVLKNEYRSVARAELSYGVSKKTEEEEFDEQIPDGGGVTIVNGKEEVRLREWTPKEIKLTKEDIETLYSVCLDRSATTEERGTKRNISGKNLTKEGKKRKSESMISVSASASGTDIYEVTPRNVIGIIELNTKVLVIQPKISVHNILFLLCYTWHPLEWRNDLNMFSPMNEDKMEALSQAIAHTFVSKTFKKSVCQGYKEVEDTLPQVRGRIVWSKQITKHMGRHIPLEVKFEEFTEDIVENRLLKAACFTLLKTKNLSPTLRKSLRLIDSKLDDVTLQEFKEKDLPDVQYSHGVNDHYKPSIDIAKFVLKNLMWTIQHGSFDAPIFLLYMPKVFEDFVVNSLRETKAMRELGASSKNFCQNHPTRFDEDESYIIKPDITFWDQSLCLFVGDCKYKRLRKNTADLEFYEEDESKSSTSDLYQMMAYMQSLSLTTGFLLYAEDRSPEGDPKRPVHYTDIKIRGSVIKRRAVNLHARPSDILEQVEGIGMEIAEVVRKKREGAV
ncbi:McrBC 5-methylcytosine restriction system component [Planoprotostelium fungivorum]|uniref:McrBC 5-methylcytosine restriction system component n=1 Tax=Planoprotostelium fungivorum TaxID=1890364 RepID=A0A2P6NMH0_9EUKA|nr:McrBC 5-methylcytosine restriction system component [Planoprotostelium fungivorum]